MTEAIITYFILVGGCAVIWVIAKITPENWLQKLWVKLHLDNDEPYEDDSY